MLAKNQKYILGLALAVFFSFSGYFVGRSGYTLKRVGGGEKGKVVISREIPGRYEGVNFSLFWEVWDRLANSYVDEAAVNQTNMVYGAIAGMVNSLGDPYTVFLTPSENKNVNEDLGGAFEGVGIQLGFTEEKKLSVTSPLEGSPAAKAGVKAGDVIVNIKDEKAGIDKDTYGITLPEAVQLIRGTRGTVVTLTLEREGKEDPLVVNLKRETIVVKSVSLIYKNLAGGSDSQVAVLKLNKFGGRTENEWVEAVDKIDKEFRKGKVRAMVLDLRNNPGGYLDQSVWMASEFIKDGVVVKQQGRNGRDDKIFDVVRDGGLLEIPLVVLVNGGSASAAEILAGALKEHGRATLVGEKTFGKGTVQQPEDLAGGAGLHITIARWLLPSGAWIDGKGVEPDVTVKNDEDEVLDEQLEAGIERLKSLVE